MTHARTPARVIRKTLFRRVALWLRSCASDFALWYIRSSRVDALVQFFSILSRTGRVSRCAATTPSSRFII